VTPSYVSLIAANPAAIRRLHESSGINRLAQSACVNEARKMPLTRPAAVLQWTRASLAAT
jgi:hypothetical protein